MSLIGENQAGFRKGYSTTDHCFLLMSIIQHYLHSRKKLFCAFIDYEKAFDKVQHAFLWKKMLNSNLTGKIFRVIQNLYRSMKSCVFKDGKKSEFFSSNIGVRQGENLSSLLFALFINDIEEYFQQKGSSHLNFNSPELANYLKLKIRHFTPNMCLSKYL